jgi:hypothetical protein
LQAFFLESGFRVEAPQFQVVFNAGRRKLDGFQKILFSLMAPAGQTKDRKPLMENIVRFGRDKTRRSPE